jgi:hypothetical protein
LTVADTRRIARAALFERFRALDRTTWIDARGRSMSPAIPAGSRLLVEFGRAPERIGEIIVFPRREELIAHRLVGRRVTIDGLRLFAKGDAEAYLDPMLAREDILGVVRRIRTPDGRERALHAASRTDAALARVSWWSGCAAGAGTRALRRLPAPARIRRAALWGLLGLSRVPTRVVTAALPRHSRGPGGGRR